MAPGHVGVDIVFPNDGPGENSDRQIDVEGPAPIGGAKNQGSDQGARRPGGGAKGAEGALHPGPLGRLVNVAQHGRGQHDQSARARALNHAKKDQSPHAGGRSARGRTGKEKRERSGQDRPPAAGVGETAQYRHDHGARQHIGGDDPSVERKSAQLPGHGGKDGGHHRALDRGHHHDQAHGKSDDAPISAKNRTRRSDCSACLPAHRWLFKFPYPRPRSSARNMASFPPDRRRKRAGARRKRSGVGANRESGFIR